MLNLGAVFAIRDGSDASGELEWAGSLVSLAPIAGMLHQAPLISICSATKRDRAPFSTETEGS